MSTIFYLPLFDFLKNILVAILEKSSTYCKILLSVNNDKILSKLNEKYVLLSGYPKESMYFPLEEICNWEILVFW